MRIALRADAGISQGSGHVVRTLTLAREFQKVGHDVLLISHIEGIPWLSQMVNQSSIDWQICTSHLLDIENISKDNFDFLVVDSYKIPSASINIAAKSIPILAIVDNNIRNITPNFVLDQNLGAVNFDTSVLTSQLIGPAYALVREEIRALRRNSSSLVNKQGDPTVLVMIGGTDPTKLAIKLSKILRDLDSEYNFHFVTADENVSAVAKWLPKNRDNIHSLTSEIQDLLKSADIAISAAGTSSLDLSCVGIPTIYFSVANNQDATLQMITSLGAGIALGQSQDIETRSEDLIRSINKCANDSSLRETLFQNSQKLVDGKGAGRVVRAVAETVR